MSWQKCLVLSLLGGASGLAPAQEPQVDAVTFGSAATSSTPRRFVLTWSAERELGDEAVEVSGVVRGLWTLTGGAEPRLLLSDPVAVRATPRTSTLAQEIQANLAAPVELVLHLDAGEARPAPSPPVAQAEAPTAPAAGQEAPADSPIPAAATAKVPALVEIASLADPALYVWGLTSLQGQRMVPGETSTVDEVVPMEPSGRQATAERTLTEVAPCPTTGPGTTCATVRTRVHYGGPAAEGEALADDTSRWELVWIVEPDPLRPHAAAIDEVFVFSTADEGEPLRYRFHADLRLLPAEPPAPMP